MDEVEFVFSRFGLFYKLHRDLAPLLGGALLVIGLHRK